MLARLKEVFSYVLKVLIWLDQGLNVVFWPVLNPLFRPHPSARFGSEDETLSSVMGKNMRLGHCKTCSFICRYILHPIDKDHCQESIEDDEHSNV